MTFHVNLLLGRQFHIKCQALFSLKKIKNIFQSFISYSSDSALRVKADGKSDWSASI